MTFIPETDPSESNSVQQEIASLTSLVSQLAIRLSAIEQTLLSKKLCTEKELSTELVKVWEKMEEIIDRSHPDTRESE